VVLKNIMNRSRSTRKRNQDLELRLGQSELEKQSTLLTSQNVALGNFIIVEDDDDEVQLSSSRIFGHNEVQPSSSRISVQSRNGVSRRAVRVPVIKDEDLELRLGLGGAPQQVDVMQMPSVRTGCLQHIRYHPITINIVPPIVPINISDDGEEDGQKYAKKRKHGHPIGSNAPPVEVKQVKLTCAICMDSMKDETSTICGHIFCRSCIMSAIQFQKKCPTCRRKLSANNVHRIFLPDPSV